MFPCGCEESKIKLPEENDTPTESFAEKPDGLYRRFFHEKCKKYWEIKLEKIDI